ncbi:MAG: hypothetical protein MI742_16340 [Desulfobacterales bacterium]|nr:hypothetical protein [Desulfobacterales bacterium]
MRLDFQKSIVTLLLFFMMGCGAADTPSEPMAINGKVDALGNPGHAVVVLTRHSDIHRVLQKGDGVVSMVTTDLHGNFSMDLKESGLTPGDTVYLSAFIPSSTDHPFLPSKGDPIGIYTHPQTHFPDLTLDSQGKKGILILLNRTMNDTQAQVCGSIDTPSGGNLILLAHQGPLVSNTFSEVDPTRIIGFAQVKATPPQTPFSMDILPVAPTPPIPNVVVIALQDKNGNGTADAGDALGFAVNPQTNVPVALTLTSGENPAIHLKLCLTLPAPSSETLLLSGAIINTSHAQGPIWIIAAKGGNPTHLLESPYENLLAFRRLSSTSADFLFDLGEAGCHAGDVASLICLAQNAQAPSPFPLPAFGDTLGWYQNPGALSAKIVSSKEGVSNLDFQATHPLYDGSCQLSGTLPDHEQEVSLILHREEPASSDFSALDMRPISGMIQIPQEETTFSFKVQALGAPFPFPNAYLMGLEDRDQNGSASPGDRIAMALEGRIPRSFSLSNQDQITDISLSFIMEVQAPTGPNARLSGALTVKELSPKQTSWVVVAKAGDLSEIFENPMKSILWFQKLTQEMIDAKSYSLPLSKMAVVPQDKVVVFGVTKRDGQGFPIPEPGDAVGIVIPQGSFFPTITIGSEDITDLNLSIELDVQNYQANVSGTVKNYISFIPHNGPTTVVIYPEELNHPTQLDPAKTLGLTRIEKNSESVDFSIGILPYGPAPPFDAWVYAWVDENQNSQADSGDAAGRSKRIIITSQSSHMVTILVAGI